VRSPFALLLVVLLCGAGTVDAPEPGFAAWLAAFHARAAGAGVSEPTLARELAGLRYNPRVVELDHAQPDRASAIRPDFGVYLASHLDNARIARGRRKIAALGPTIARIEARYGVPGPLLVAIWGMETDYGASAGRFDLVRSLASLAYEGRRRELFERELIAALGLIDKGDVTRTALVGSWAGATGQPQFLPSSYARLAVDGDGDGRADIWGNEADTLASIANYLKLNGWRAGARWGMPVIVPPSLQRWRARAITIAPTCPRPLAEHSRWLTVAQWRALGLADAGGRGWPPGTTLATLIEPDGPGREAYLTFGGYRSLLAYNCSNFYALSVGLLGDRLR